MSPRYISFSILGVEINTRIITCTSQERCALNMISDVVLLCMIAENWSHLLPIYSVEKKKCQTASGLCDSQIHTTDTLNTFFSNTHSLPWAFVLNFLPSCYVSTQNCWIFNYTYFCAMQAHVFNDKFRQLRLAPNTKRTLNICIQ